MKEARLYILKKDDKPLYQVEEIGTSRFFRNEEGFIPVNSKGIDISNKFPGTKDGFCRVIDDEFVCPRFVGVNLDVSPYAKNVSANVEWLTHNKGPSKNSREDMIYLTTLPLSDEGKLYNIHIELDTTVKAVNCNSSASSISYSITANRKMISAHVEKREKTISIDFSVAGTPRGVDINLKLEIIAWPADYSKNCIFSVNSTISRMYIKSGNVYHITEIYVHDVPLKLLNLSNNLELKKVEVINTDISNIFLDKHYEMREINTIGNDNLRGILLPGESLYGNSHYYYK